MTECHSEEKTMPTAVIDDDTVAMPLEDPSIAKERFFYRWLGEAHPLAPDASEAMLQAYFAAWMDTDAPPSIEELVGALDCDEAVAESWLSYLLPRLLDPRHYGFVFAAEEAMNTHRQQREAFQLRCQQVQERLTALDAEIVALDRLGDVSEERRDEADKAIAPLRQERRELLTSQERELPAQAQLYSREGEEVKRQLEVVQHALQGARQTHLQAVEADWIAESLAALQPLLAQHYQRMRHVDEARRQLGQEPSREHGMGRLVETLVQAVRQAAGVQVGQGQGLRR
jgi:hypothetical protein